MTAKLTKLTDRTYMHTLLARLVPVVDRVRDLKTRLGLRPYSVRIIRTRWSHGERGEGVEQIVSETEILPTPAVGDLSSLSAELRPVGIDEVGAIVVSEISGTYTEDTLRGYEAGGGVENGDTVYWEIETFNPDGSPGERRRFTPAATPFYDAGGVQWAIALQSASGSRTRSGSLH